MLWTIERITGDIAVVESADGEMFSIPRALLPSDVCEGQMYRLTREESEETQQSNRIQGLMDRLFD